MASTKDKTGRPIVVVTGLGVVTSLGAGKTDNWAKLTAGESGIRAITRFPTDGLKTRIAGTVDFLGAAGLLRRAGRAFRRTRRRGGDRRIRHRRQRAIFPGRCSSRCRRSRSNGRSGSRSAAARAPTTRSTYSDLLRVSARISRLSPPLPVRFGRRPSGRRRSAPRARRFRCRPPAPRARARSSSASRRSAAARPTPRCASAPTARSIRKR